MTPTALSDYRAIGQGDCFCWSLLLITLGVEYAAAGAIFGTATGEKLSGIIITDLHLFMEKI